MIPLLIVTHGRFGEELLKTAEGIAGKQEKVEAITLLSSESKEALKEKILDSLQRLESKNGLLIFTDMVGGTPCNISLPIAKEEPIEVITGINLNMLTSAFAHRGHLNRFELAQKVSEDGRRAIVNAKEVFLKKCP